ncbi:uncharacterized protein CC84DRAFT_1203964 [Paraphaeosphaeria sporulosa]|uniref:Rhodopsin domain-containing protein n=1 Tax=Paraphaeosphaeria sporulosa TaxID=1460663 RepID=A0A177CP30_9PLEO|nr:uncharacterized protein CC84DRAFT_1203964 [Paraphaeosphaeria sporulosa]OAG08640.1 hypothetical protein CC84DRAFT_1203964 [Paraphaeosphaeria sporulosa]
MSGTVSPTLGSVTPVAHHNPLMVPPPGGWIDPSRATMHYRAVILVAPITAFYILDLLVLLLRAWSRYIKKSSWRLSDYFIFIASIFGTGYIAICWLVAERAGIGYPIIQVAPHERLLIRKAFFAAWLLQSWANSFIRLSILDFLLQVFAPEEKFCLAINFFQAATSAYLIACTIAWLATCRPFRYNWELGPDVPRHCGNLQLKFFLSAIFNLVLDVGILILPMPMLWTLQINTRKKITISLIFGLGSFVCFATAWRTYHVVKFSKPHNQINFTMGVVEDALWSGLEITLGIINACLPAMQPAVQHLVRGPYQQLLEFSTSRFSKRSKSSTGYSSTSGHSRFTPWARISGSENGLKTGIEREVGYSVDSESNSSDRIPMENVGSTTQLATQVSVTYHDPLTNKYRRSNNP